jgi:hypothetical protein
MQARRKLSVNRVPMLLLVRSTEQQQFAAVCSSSMQNRTEQNGSSLIKRYAE